jgi:uncharacterized membrane protein YeaQ/YmgE (transglycosylase-associated protein family)
MGILMFIVFGFVIGLLARAILPGSQKMGFLMTAGLGIAGSFIGGFIAASSRATRSTSSTRRASSAASLAPWRSSR